MLVKLVEYHWAEDVDDVLLLLGRLDVKTVPLAGGTYLLGLQDDTIEAVVDLRDLGLSYISEDQQGVHIGAMTTLENMATSAVLQELAGGIVAQAAHASSSSHLIRNSATLGGTLGSGIASQADLWTALIAIDAEVVVRSGSQTQVNLSGGTLDRPGLPLSGVIFKGKQERRIPCRNFLLERRASELILEVVIPTLAPHASAAFQRVARLPGDAAVLNAAALVEIENERYHRVRVVLGGAACESVRLLAAERHLEGKAVGQPLDTQVMFHAVQLGIASFRPPQDLRSSSGYRRFGGMQLAFRVLEEASNTAYWRSTVSSERAL